MTKNKATKKEKNRKRTARIICRDRSEFWTTQAQFWQWIREFKIVKLQHNPLTGAFVQPHEEKMVVRSNTVLDLAHPHHLSECLTSRRFMKRRRA